jgi:hypothetical protein
MRRLDWIRRFSPLRPDRYSSLKTEGGASCSVRSCCDWPAASEWHDGVGDCQNAYTYRSTLILLLSGIPFPELNSRGGRRPKFSVDQSGLDTL